MMKIYNMDFHYHKCSNCSEKWVCDLDCSIFPDLRENDDQFGANAICPLCEETVVIKVKTEDFSPEWWSKYCGFIKDE
jgi:hypothetical protein